MQGRKGLKAGFKAGLIIGLISLPCLSLIYGLDLVTADSSIGEINLQLFFWLIFAGLISIPILGLLTGLVGGLIGGLRADSNAKTTYPGQRIFFSIRNSVIFITLLGLPSVLFIILSFTLNDELDTGIIYGLIVMLLVTVTIGIPFGGFPVIQHYILRVVIIANKFLPWRLFPFLDHCVDLIFLRRVGGGYIFVHRLLMEHFADMYTEGEK
jgi:hypothetical protein